MTELALIILSCTKLAARRRRQLSTWLSPGPAPWFHIIGNPDLPTEFAVHDHLIYVQCKDDYISLPKKTYLAILAIRTMWPNIQHIIKTDDDVDCNFEAWKALVPRLPDYDYGGYFFDRTKEEHIQYHYKYAFGSDRAPKLIRGASFAVGPFYFLSRAAIDHILGQKELFWDSTYEDNTVGYALKSMTGLRILHMPTLYSVFTEIADPPVTKGAKPWIFQPKKK